MRLEQRFVEKVQVAATIGRIEKAWQSIVTALHDMLRDAWQVESRLSGHRPRIGARTRRRYERQSPLAAGKLLG